MPDERGRLLVQRWRVVAEWMHRVAVNMRRRLRNLGMTQIRTPLGPPQANAIAERRVRSARAEGLDYICVFNARHLRRVLAEYVAYFNHWRPHR